MSQSILPDKDYSALKQAAYQLSSCTEQIFQEIEQQQTLSRIIDKIRACNDLDSIFNTTATEIRNLLNADRVGVFQFDQDSNWNSGSFMAEDVCEGYPSALKAKVEDHCFGSQFALYYAQGRVQAVSDIYEAGLSDCHIKILSDFEVRANLIVPVLKNDYLWGLICVHQCGHPRRWQPSEIEFVQKISTHFAVALQLSDQFEQVRDQATLLAKIEAQEKSLQRLLSLVKISNRIRQSFDFEVICQTATHEARVTLNVSRVAIYRFNPDWSGDFLFESNELQWNPLVGVMPTIHDTHLQENQGGRYAHNESFSVPDIYEANHSPCHIELLEQFQARAYVIVPIFQREKLWGLLATFQNDGPRQWEEDEIELLNQVGEQIGIAISQSQAVQKITEQSQTLQETLEHLQQSQDELIQKEKMAALGQLVAGVAHEINNPLGAIQAAANNTQKALQEVTSSLPLLHQKLTLEEQTTLFLLIERAIISDSYISSVERRAIKRSLIETLQNQQINSARMIADLLMDMGVQTNIETFLPLIKSPQGLWALQFAYNLTSASVNNETIIQAVERSSKIVFALKNYARIEQSTKPQLTNIQEGIETTLKIYHNQIKKNIDVIRNIESGLPRIMGYPDELIQVWTNLIHNAIQAMENGGTLTISAREENGGILVGINDNGPGILAEKLDQIFNAFYTTKPIGKGSGLGLYICQRIVGKHQGRIKVDSHPANTTFEVWLPIEISQELKD